MAPATPPAAPTPSPGSMTVSFLFGWQHIVTAVVLVVVVAGVFFVLAAAGRNVSERAEFEAWLDARSTPRPGPLAEPEHTPVRTDGASERARPRSAPVEG